MTTIHATFARRGSRLTMLASTVLALGMTAVQAQEVTLDFWDQNLGSAGSMPRRRSGSWTNGTPSTPT